MEIWNFLACDLDFDGKRINNCEESAKMITPLKLKETIKSFPMCLVYGGRISKVQRSVQSRQVQFSCDSWGMVQR